MKFNVSQSSFADAIATVSRAVPSRPTHPVLGNVLLIAKGGKLSITGFDLSLGIKVTIEADIATEGTITIPAKLLSEIVSKLSGEITVEVIENQVEVTHSSGKLKINALDAEEYPALPTIEDVTPLSIAVGTLQRGIDTVAFAASTDETKQLLTGIHISSKNGEIEFAATNGHFLSVLTISRSEDAPKIEDFSITLPAKALSELNRMLQGCDPNDLISAYFDSTQAVFEIGENRLTCRVLDGAYPAYNQLIPKQFSRVVTLDKKKLVSAVERVSVLGAKDNLIRFDIKKDTNEIILSVDAQDVGSARETVMADVKGENGQIAFNSVYLKSGLSHVVSPEVQMNLNEGNQPVTFTPLNGDKMVFLCMPVQIVK